MSQLTFGMTTICGNTIPFCYEYETEKITISPGSRLITIPDKMDQIVGQKFGMMTGGNILYKLSVPLSNDCMAFVGKDATPVSLANQERYVDYFIEDYYENSSYTEMRLRFPELNYFIPSTSRTNLSKDEIIFFRIKETLYNFDIKYCDTMVSVSFNIGMNMNQHVKSIAETISEVSLKFPETDDLEYLIELYNDVRCFFSFICNRQNIGLRNAELIGNYPRKTIENSVITDSIGYTSQKLVLSQKYLEPLEDEKKVKKTPNSSLFSENLQKLFQLFFPEKAEGIALVNRNSIHSSFKYRNLIDLEQSLHITTTFEYYMRAIMPEISSQETIDFYKDINAFVDEYISKSSGKRKQKAKEFKKTLRPPISLKEKVVKAYEGYSTWQPLKPILSEWFGDDITVLAKTANDWRNELAHAKREYQPSINVINAIRLVEHVNYCIVLRHAGYNDEQIKSIISDTLIRYKFDN